MELSLCDDARHETILLLMKYSRISLLAAAFFATGLLASGAPEDTYAEADSLICLSKMLEGKKAYADAHKNITQAIQALGSLKSSSPNWKPDWVERKLAAAREAEERLAPLAKENPSSTADLWKGADYSVPPAPPSKLSNVEESLKPTMNAALGYRAPVEVMEGSPHAAYIESDPHYAQYQKNLRIQSRSRQKSLRVAAPADSQSAELDRIRQQQEALARQRQAISQKQAASNPAIRSRFAPAPVDNAANQARLQALAAEQAKLQEKERQLEQERRQAAIDAERRQREANQRQEAIRQQQAIDAQRRQQQIQQQMQQKARQQQASPSPKPAPAPTEGRRSRFRIG